MCQCRRCLNSGGAVLAVLLKGRKDWEGEQHGKVGLRQLGVVLKVLHRPLVVLVLVVLGAVAHLRSVDTRLEMASHAFNCESHGGRIC